MPANFRSLRHSRALVKTQEFLRDGRALTKAQEIVRDGRALTKAQEIVRHGRALTKVQKVAVAGAATLTAAAVAVPVAVIPGDAHTAVSADAVSSAPVQVGSQPIKDVKASVTDQLAGNSVKIQAIEAKKQAAFKAAAKQRAEAAAKHKAEAARQAKAASRSAQRPQMQTVAAATTYGNNLDGWIRQSLSIMKQHNIPGSYSGLHRNIMRESSGNPMAINNWDINAQNGIPSKGLLQVIDPTFRTYHVPGTSWNIYDPVANITAACNYAAHRYGTMDNVNSAY
ncbi:transglycosylase SLT domain-containing protein [Streptomyces carpinensis]|uniref:Transglycosylase SLT domain-containing protein n=1 Tax=Streptomyces carpinensis TaxID=66369 RepID=A0ABV1W9C8_9ACTN|nr:transglycosylase SLT domain-containing protein [Streptomyces carpinensis]